MLEIRYKLKLIGILLFLTLAVGFFFSFFFSGIYQDTLEELTYRFSFGPRLAYYSFIFELWKQYPVLGVGIGNYGFHAASYFSSSLLVSAHGIFWQSLVETGILGFLVFCLLILIYYRTMIQTLVKVRGTYWYPYLIGYLASFTAMMIQYLTFGDRFNLYFWFFLGISMATLRIIGKEKILAK